MMEAPWPLAILVGLLVAAALIDTFLLDGWFAGAMDKSDER
jgi:hypothetical protein